MNVFLTCWVLQLLWLAGDDDDEEEGSVTFSDMNRRVLTLLEVFSLKCTIIF